MTTAALPQTADHEPTVADLAARFGSLPARRIRTDVSPGFATEDDVERLRREEGVLCELIDGVLVEKAVSDKTAFLAIEIAGLLREFVRPRKCGWLLGPDGFTRLFGTRLRAPDVSFVRPEQRPQGLLGRGYADGAPALAIEVFSPGNTRREMDEKRAEYLACGAEAVWIVFPETQTIEVATSPDTVQTLGRSDTLTGEPVLPGFSVKVADLFDAADLGRGNDNDAAGDGTSSGGER